MVCCGRPMMTSGKKWGTFSRAQDLLLVSDGVLVLSFDDLGGKSGEHEAEPGTPSLYQMVCCGRLMMTSGKSGEHLVEPGTPSLYQLVCLGLSFDDLRGKKWGTFSGAGDPLLQKV